MKILAKLFFLFLVLGAVFSCDKGDGGNCSTCDEVGAVLCNQGDGTFTASLDGEEVTAEIPDGMDWEALVGQFCAALTNNDENSCYLCEGPNVEGFDICVDNGQIYVDFEYVMDLPDGYTFPQFVQLLGENPDNDPTFEGLECSKN